jgi:hypothetical protein
VFKALREIPLPRWPPAMSLRIAHVPQPMSHEAWPLTVEDTSRVRLVPRRGRDGATSPINRGGPNDGLGCVPAGRPPGCAAELLQSTKAMPNKIAFPT